MKFYDIDALENKCGTDNKYRITAMVAARARWLSEQKMSSDGLPANEKYLSEALWEIDNGKLPAEWVEELERNAQAPSSVGGERKNEAKEEETESVEA